MAIGDFYTLKVLAQNTVNGIYVETQFHFEQTGVAIFGTSEEDLVNSFIDNAAPLMTSCFHNNYSILQFQVIPRPGTAVSYEQSVSPITGGLSGDQLPPQNSAIISIKTARLDKSGRGRSYMFPASESASNSAGQPAGTYQVDVNTFAASLNPLEGGLLYADFQVGVWSEKEQEFNAATSLVTRLYWGSQRGRRF